MQTGIIMLPAIGIAGSLTELPPEHSRSQHGALPAGGQWQAALALFDSMDERGLRRDAITYSSLISALAKGKQWVLALKVRCEARCENGC